ncbi:lipase family alpha/beta hydrolase [Speluncibacter jeojiensis]|uniref:Lipase family protein n=1 Tax=Speluncibacter jeojiensis TaxID=2710754 RepID=A0A9X4M0V2_9ACTN|nr:lipase family protein [Corynebacteriales bacterium D3-21]
MRKWYVSVVVAALTLVASALAAPAIAGADPAPVPVPYNFFSGIGPELLHPGGSLPGENDWNCKPTAAHPEPVILLHGTAGGVQTNWGTYVPLLENAGYCVFGLTYGALPGTPWPVSAIGGMMPIEQSAQQLSVFVDKVLAATGASKVDFVGHSQGTLMPNYYVRFLGGAPKVDKYVSLAPLWEGTDAFGAGEILAGVKQFDLTPVTDATMGKLCPSCLEMASGSNLIKKMNSDGGPYAPGVTYTNISTRYDEFVVPYTSGQVPGPHTTNIVVQDNCSQDYSDHMAIAGSPVAAGYVLNALDPQHPQPVPCVFVPPFTG